MSASSEAHAALVRFPRRSFPFVRNLLAENAELQAEVRRLQTENTALEGKIGVLEDAPPSTDEIRARARDLVTEILENYDAEPRSCDVSTLPQVLADRGWWIVWGAHVAHTLDVADQAVEKAEAEVRRLRVVEAAARAYGDARLTPGEQHAWIALRDALGGD